MSEAPTTADSAKIPISPKLSRTQAVTTEIDEDQRGEDQRRRDLQRIFRFDGEIGFAASAVRAVAIRRARAQRPTAHSAEKRGRKLQGEARSKTATTMPMRRYITEVATTMPAEMSAGAVLASRRRLASTMVVAVDE